MDFISGLVKSGQQNSGSDQPSNAEEHSNSDLFASAKVVADAAQAQFSNEPEEYDKGKVAGAAADLLDSASEYGQLDETQGIGQYVDQAEGYLRQYNTPASDYQMTTTTEDPSGGGAGDYIKKADEFLNRPSEGVAEDGGAGDYIEKAEEFLNKPSSDDGENIEPPSQSEGGYGGLLKDAGGFFNK